MKPSHLSRQSAGAQYAAMIGKEENRNWQGKFKTYQATQRVLTRTAARMAERPPQHRHPLALLFLQAVVAPMWPTPPSRQVIAGTMPGGQHSHAVTAPSRASESSPDRARPYRQRATETIAPLTHSITAHPGYDHAGQLRIKRDADVQSPPSVAPANATQPRVAPTLNNEDDDTPADIQLENAEVFQLLKECQQVTGEVSDLPEGTLLKLAIRFSDADVTSMQQLASRLQHANALYGGNLHEPMSTYAQRNIVRDWLTRNFLRDNLSTVLQEEIAFQGAGVTFTNADLNQFVIKLLTENADNYADINAWLLQHLFFEELPSLNYFYTLRGLSDPSLEQLKNLDLYDFRWGQMHAGLRFAQSLEVPIEQISIQQALQLGLMLHSQLQEGSVPESWWGFFKLPAIIRYTQDFPESVIVVPARQRAGLLVAALLHYQRAFQEHQEKHNPVRIFSDAMAAYKTRSQLASALIAKHCPGLSVTHYLTMKTLACVNMGGVYVSVPLYQIPEPKGRVVLPYINDIYDNHVTSIANAYDLLDKLLLLDALGQLEHDDLRKWSKGLIKRLWISFSSADVLNSRPFVGANQHARESLVTKLDETVEFFQTQLSGEKQIYALQRTSNGYSIKRVGETAQDYFEFLTTDRRPISDANFKLKINSDNASLKTPTLELDVLLDKIVATHRQIFAKQLYEYGYEKTSAEAIGEFLLSLIPFYTCVTSIKAGKVNEAVIACGMDAISLLPLIGRLTTLSFKVTNTLGRGGLIAAHNAASQIASHNALRLVLQHAGTQFTRYSLLPASLALGKKELSRLGLATLRSIDPGFELIGQLSLSAVRQFFRLSYEISPLLQQLHHLFPDIGRGLEQLTPQTTPGDFIFARLPAHEKQVPVTKLAGERYQDLDIYVRVNPDTGEPFGRKYVLQEDRLLKPVPPGLARRMHNILTYGLSGRNSPQQGATWAAQRIRRNPITHTLLRQMQESIDIGGDLQQLATQQHVAHERLLRFIVPTGELTALGRHLFALAEAAQISVNAIPVRPYSVMQLPRQVLASPFVRFIKPSVLSPEQLVISLLDSVEPNKDIANNFSIKNGVIMTDDGSRFTYDIDLNVFVKNRSDESTFLYVVDKETHQLDMITEQEARRRAASVSVDDRTAVIKALGIDLDLASAISHCPPMPGPQLPIPKRISFIWVGDKRLSQSILGNLADNCHIANAHGYKVYVYLSEQSKAINYQELSDAICAPASCDPTKSPQNQIKILETTKFYSSFKSSIHFAQYQDAITGNANKPTNFASAADILRLSVVKEKGGLYMDVDDTLTDEIGEKLIKIDANGLALPGLMTSGQPVMDHMFGSSFFGAHQNSKTLDAILQEIHRRYQLPEYRGFYHLPRPDPNDQEALTNYANKLSYLTGPDVFNHVVLKRAPTLRHFREVSMLQSKSYRPHTSHLLSEILEHIPDAAEITPLANTFLVGSLHSWTVQRRRRRT